MQNEAVESAEQLTGMWTALVQDQGSPEIRDGELDIRWADSAFGFYNMITSAEAGVGVGRLTDKLHGAAAFLRDHEAAGFLWLFESLLTPEALAALPGLAEEAGLAPAMTCYGMAGDVLPLPEPRHSELRFERVTTEAHLEAYALLNARGYGLPEAPAVAAFRGSRLWREEVFAYLGYRGDQPVCCAGTYPVDGRLFVVLVATDPTQQRRGYGEAVTRKALYEGGRATGLTRATLQASQAGRPVYERIGLTCNSPVELYTLKR